jgi:hypothetical protein
MTFLNRCVNKFVCEMEIRLTPPPPPPQPHHPLLPPSIFSTFKIRRKRAEFYRIKDF